MITTRYTRMRLHAGQVLTKSNEKECIVCSMVCISLLVSVTLQT